MTGEQGAHHDIVMMKVSQGQFPRLHLGAAQARAAGPASAGQGEGDHRQRRRDRGRLAQAFIAARATRSPRYDAAPRGPYKGQSSSYVSRTDRKSV